MSDQSRSQTAARAPHRDPARLRQAIDEGWGVDLHGHSRHSDGAWTPSELVRDALGQHVRLMALTDHDTVAGQAEALATGSETGMLVITGAEITTWVNGRAYHLLCYDLDHEDPAWYAIGRRRREGIGAYYAAVLGELRKRGYAVRDADVQDEAGLYIRNPINESLVRAGAAPDLAEAKQLVRSLELEFPIQLLAITLEELAAELPASGALISVAHPAREERGVSNQLLDCDVQLMREAIPLAALEAYHPFHTPSDVERYRDMAAQFGLGTTCGSDAHGWQVNRPPVPHGPELCREFLDRLLGRWS